MVFGCFGSVADELHFCLCPGLVASRFLPTYCGHLLLLRGFQRCPFGSVWKGCERAVFGLPELGFRWCLAVFRIMSSSPFHHLTAYTRTRIADSLRIAGVGGMGGSPYIRQCRVTPKAKPSVALAIGRFRPCRRPPK